jgi:Uma2 family endonuclease
MAALPKHYWAVEEYLAFERASDQGYASQIHWQAIAYPSMSVVCEPPQFEDEHQDTLVNPVLVAEVLSPSTEQVDRGKKFEHYRRLASLRDYVLISQTRWHIEVFSWQSDTSWLCSEVTPHDSIELPSVGRTLGFNEVYRKVSLPEG